jgi:tetratricopeptide (TPR) repeat protein
VATEGPHEQALGEGITVGARLIVLGHEIGNREPMFQGHDHRLNGFWLLGDRAALDVELDVLDALADELRQPAQRWEVGTHRTMLALMEGRFEDAERLIDETHVVGRRAATWAAVTQRIALFVLRREQGRLAEVADTIRRSVHEYPALLRFRCVLAHLEAELGREQEACAVLDDLLDRDLSREHRDSEWLFAMCVLADPTAALAEKSGVQRLYAALVPYQDLYAIAPSEGLFGAVARALGVLATALGRYDDAERHFAHAATTHAELEAPGFLARTNCDWALALLERGGPRDAERAQRMLDDATAAAREIGAAGIERRAAEATAGAR